MNLRTVQLLTAVLGFLLLLYAFAAGDTGQAAKVRLAGMVVMAVSFIILSYIQFANGRKHD